MVNAGRVKLLVRKTRRLLFSTHFNRIQESLAPGSGPGVGGSNPPFTEPHPYQQRRGQRFEPRRMFKKLRFQMIANNLLQGCGQVISYEKLAQTRSKMAA